MDILLQALKLAPFKFLQKNIKACSPYSYFPVPHKYKPRTTPLKNLVRLKKKKKKKKNDGRYMIVLSTKTEVFFTNMPAAYVSN